MGVLLKNDGVTSRSLQTNKEYSIYRQDKHLPESYKIKDRTLSDIELNVSDFSVSMDNLIER